MLHRPGTPTTIVVVMPLSEGPHQRLGVRFARDVLAPNGAARDETVRRALRLRRHDDSSFCVPDDCDTQALRFDDGDAPQTARLQTSGLSVGVRRLTTSR